MDNRSPPRRTLSPSSLSPVSRNSFSQSEGILTPSLPSSIILFGSPFEIEEEEEEGDRTDSSLLLSSREDQNHSQQQQQYQHETSIGLGHLAIIDAIQRNNEKEFDRLIKEGYGRGREEEEEEGDYSEFEGTNSNQGIQSCCNGIMLGTSYGHLDPPIFEVVRHSRINLLISLFHFGVDVERLSLFSGFSVLEEALLRDDCVIVRFLLSSFPSLYDFALGKEEERIAFSEGREEEEGSLLSPPALERERKNGSKAASILCGYLKMREFVANWSETDSQKSSSFLLWFPFSIVESIGDLLLTLP